MQDFRDLKVWDKAHAMTLAIYRATETFPTAERYGLTSQMRRAAASIPTNIAEGCGRGSDAELARFLQIAFDSASELEYLLLLARDLNMLGEAPHDEIASAAQEVKRVLAGLITRLKADS